MPDFFERSKIFESSMKSLNFGAPVSVENIRDEVDEIATATNHSDRAKEFGDVLCLLARLAAAEGIDLEKEGEAALQRSISRTAYVLKRTNFTSKTTWDEIREHWTKAKRMGKINILAKVSLESFVEDAALRLLQLP